MVGLHNAIRRMVYVSCGSAHSYERCVVAMCGFYAAFILQNIYRSDCDIIRYLSVKRSVE
jgi:hypothetical protein